MIKDYNGVIVCASKYFSCDEIRTIYQKGYHDFGENRVQLMVEKMEQLKDLDINWHFIGHLQSNKVSLIINEIDYLHTLDRLSVAKAIQKHAKHKIKCFIQMNLTEEVQKSGVYVDKLPQFLLEIKKYDKIELVGLMTIGMDEDMIKTEEVFKQLYDLSKEYHLPLLSMGMTHDYELAIKHHATHVRIGRKFYELLN
ncbi:YggS family pyridoxal phosphate-dependent enzyme [Mariniplasma anaerobium]|uniref:YggS family pyridoxal phosphate enzyme n=1 Tax=Mariniplasma anaerobium TaxID=2735436 RepID=A0A7U9XX75_9MOLU|nr:YggS family pyridoxal phosphate-dependent enzyme [Mariniplasma anaerobium]BCR35936.1 YggS family pyridoxal phosphate enzyme [Mariniplasma anaerobium]